MTIVLKTLLYPLLCHQFFLPLCMLIHHKTLSVIQSLNQKSISGQRPQMREIDAQN